MRPLPDYFGHLSVFVKLSVKKAYYKLSLPFHPQIAGSSFIVARKFQALGKVYDVLSDVNKRILYNREGWLTVE